MSFDEFYEYFKVEYERRKEEGVALTSAIREIAGLETPVAPKTEAYYLNQFDRIFNP